MADLLPIFLVFLIAGAVKGVAGFGLPTVSIPCGFDDRGLRVGMQSTARP